MSTQAVADIIRTTLGPRAMLKMLLGACPVIVQPLMGWLGRGPTRWHGSGLTGPGRLPARSLPPSLPLYPRRTDPMGGIVITNDGHCILREVDVSHPAAKSMIELSRAQVGVLGGRG